MSRSRSMRKRKVVGLTEEEDMSVLDIEEFRTEIVNAGARLADLLVVEYPNAHLVDNALFGVTEIVECFGLKGRWVTSWTSSARNEFLATESVHEVGDCVAVIVMTAKFVFLSFSFVCIDYLAGSN